jgi:hypothetical protein
MKRWQQIIVCLGVTILLVALASTLMASAKSNPALTITLFSSPPKDATQYNSYPIQVSWTNPSKNVYQGYFLYIVESKHVVNPSNIIFSFKGAEIKPIQSGSTLLYYLPIQTFPGGKSGIVTADIVYNNAANYKWQIGITQTKSP